MTLVALRDAHDESELGGKAVQLGAALRAGLRVPEGFALSASSVDAIVAGDDAAIVLVGEALARVGASAAARSSAIGAESASPCLAERHLACLALATPADALESVLRIAWSARSDAALAYRRRVGISGSPRIGVVLQRLVTVECAGVLFTCDPHTKRGERVALASWGLGEAVVAKRVRPDRVRIDRAGMCLEAKIANKEVALVARAGGGTEEVSVPVDRALRPCLDDARIAALHELAVQYEAAFGDGPHDLEFAFASDGLWLLNVASSPSA